MLRKMDEQSSVPTITKLAEKNSKDFLQQVLHPRGIKIISGFLVRQALESLQKDIRIPDQLELKQELGDAFVEFDTSAAAKVFEAMEKDNQNEAMHEVEYRKYFLKSGPYRSINTVCRCVQKKMIVDGSEQRTWIPRPVVTDRRKSGLAPSTKVWDFVHKVYPGKAGNKDQDKYFIPDHIYAVNGRDEAEQETIALYAEQLPGFLLMAERGGMKPPYLIQESKDHKGKEREARQYLSLLAASVLHDRMLLRWLSDEAEETQTIALDPELCIYGMTCCGVLVTLYKMSIRDIWSKTSTSKVGDPVRYDFVSVENFFLDIPSDCTRLSNWMNTLHYYGRTTLAESMMQDGGEAYSGMKITLEDWREQASQVVFCYGKEPNTATFNAKYTDTGNKDNDKGDDEGGGGHEDDEDDGGHEGEGGHEGDEGDEGDEGHGGDGDDEGDGGDGGHEGHKGHEDSADNAPPAPKRQKLSGTFCDHKCLDKVTKRGDWCEHGCCQRGRAELYGHF
jgi:hypothetical protein